MKKNTVNEDWLAVISGAALIALCLMFKPADLPRFGWTKLEELGLLVTVANFKASSLSMLILATTGVATLLTGNKKLQNLLAGISFLFVVSIVAQILAGNTIVKNYGFEYVIFALVLGIVLRSLIGVPSWLKDSLQSEFFIKTGLVLLGTTILFRDLLRSGSLGMVQALLVVIVVWYFAYWLARRFKIDDEMSLMISSSVSICGVSAAIATCGAIQGDSKKLSYVVSLVLLVALPMMLIMPAAAGWLGLGPSVAGAWIGGTIDTTGAVVATGAQLGEEALNVSTIVKLSQNVLLGVSAVAISFFWMVKNKKDEQAKPNLALIWDRFPKFVLAFLAASCVFSFVVSVEAIADSKDFIKSIQTSLFALAFVSIGLETDLSILVKTGNGRPALVFILAQLFNVAFTLAVAYWLFA